MGSCICTKSIQSNFPVTLIHELTEEYISSGTLYITVAELSYLPSGKVEPEFVGLSITYGVMDGIGNCFFLEAGHRCPRGEGNFD